MSTEQILIFGLLLGVFVFLIWGRWRYDAVAFSALVIALIVGVVPTDQAFSGFGHPATIIIALVLVASRGLSNSGAIELISRFVVRGSRRVATHIGVMSGFAAVLSAVMNNVAALALLMPVDMQAAKSAKRSPAISLMPLSFASILGGMITLIGTPPNIVIAEFRQDAMGSAYRMFDFAPVGLACSIVGVAFIATIGWRLIPMATRDHDSPTELFDLHGYIAEVVVPESSSAVDKLVMELDEVAEENEVAIIGLIRRGKRMPGMARQVRIKPDDRLVLESAPAGIDKLVGALGLTYVRAAPDDSPGVGEDLALVEVVVPEGARIAGRSALSLRLLYRHDVTLLGVSRQGRRFTEQVRKLDIESGDVLLLLGPDERLAEITTWLGCLPLAQRGLQLIQRDKAMAAVAIFGGAVLLASLGVLYLPVALAAAVVLMVAFGIVRSRQVYESIEWSVIVLLGSMIPIGVALESSGGTAMIAGAIVTVAGEFSPEVVLALLIIVTMTLSDVMNNTATAVIAAPIAFNIADQLDCNPDTFLMGVAVAASCAFLTPIGHKNNTLIMGPGGYRFGDYWRMGLPLEILVVVVATPTILIVWPL